MNEVEILESVKELLTPREHWTQGAWARTDMGEAVGSTSPAASCWCLSGAYNKVTAEEPFLAKEEGAEEKAGHFLYIAVPGGSIPHFNDNWRTTHEDVLEVLDKAIALAKEAK